MNESSYKSFLVKEIERAGGYARRIEDQYAVGVLDMIIILPEIPSTLFVEAKVVDGRKFAPSPRQYLEGLRIIKAGGTMGSADAALLGFRGREMCLAPWDKATSIDDTRVVVRGPNETVTKFFQRWYYGRGNHDVEQRGQPAGGGDGRSRRVDVQARAAAGNGDGGR